MLEVAHIDYWIECTFSEALIYCQFLNINEYRDWRLPTSAEATLHIGYIDAFWHMEDTKFIDDNFECTVAPVRDKLPKIVK